MARRTGNKSTSDTPKTTEAPAEANTEAQEGNMSTSTDESVEAPTTAPTPENTESTPAEKPAEAPIDLTDFNAAAEAAVAEADTSTGVVPDAEVSKVVVEYRALDGAKAKNQAKNHLNESMKAAMNDTDIVKARAFLQLHDSMTAGSKSGSSEKVPADPTEAFVQKVVTLKLAGVLTTPGEGVSDDWADKANALFKEAEGTAREYLTWLADESEDKGEEPAASAVVKNAAKLALGKAAKAGSSVRAGSTYSGERRDIAKHIVEAFDAHEVGTFLTIAEIRKFESAEYGKDAPSAGAISARLFPKTGESTMPKVGIKPDENEAGRKGAVKIDVEG